MKIIKIALAALSVLIVAAIPASFVMSGSVLTPIAGKILRVRVDPGFTGGPVMASFFDEAGDDNGGGTLTYPLHEAFQEGNLCDLIAYEVYRPMVDAPWNKEENFWQIGVSLAKLENPLEYQGGFSGLQIAVYIDIDGAVGGSSATLHDRAEYVSFPRECPWDIMILFDGKKEDTAQLYFSNGQKREIRAIIVPETNSMYARIPLDNPVTARVLDGRETRHWVFAGPGDPLGTGGWINVRSTESLRAGGGALWDESPRVYDILVPEGFSQKEVLSEGNKNDEGLVTVPPLVAPGFDPAVGYRRMESGGSQTQSLVQSLAAQAAEEEKVNAEQARKALEKQLALGSDLEKLEAHFGLGNYEAARKLCGRLLAADQENPVLLAYMGSFISMDGGKASNPMQAIAFVQEGFTYLDKAVNLAEKLFAESSSGETAVRVLVTALMNRASVAASVPNDVFGKLGLAVADFSRVAELYASLGNGSQSAASYMQAAFAAEAEGKKNDARLLWMKVLAVENRGTKASLELAKRGYLK